MKTINTDSSGFDFSLPEVTPIPPATIEYTLRLVNSEQGVRAYFSSTVIAPVRRGGQCPAVIVQPLPDSGRFRVMFTHKPPYRTPRMVSNDLRWHRSYLGKNNPFVDSASRTFPLVFSDGWWYGDYAVTL